MCRRDGAALALAALVLLAGCRQEMARQPSYRPLEASPFFADGRAARPLPHGTVPRGGLVPDTLRPGAAHGGSDHRHAGNGNSAWYALDDLPLPVTPAVMARGRERYGIFCSPCHGLDGAGDGMVARRGFSRPPTFHQDRLRQAPAAHFAEVMARGYGAMPPYAEQVPLRDRWAIAAYIRALQLSQHAPLAALPPELQARARRSAP